MDEAQTGHRIRALNRSANSKQGQRSSQQLLDGCQGRGHCRQTSLHLNPPPPAPTPLARMWAKSIKAMGHPGGLTRRKGMMLSLAMACSKRGAPVRLWRPAPHVEKKEPTTMTQGEGQARVPTTRLPFTASPNLERDREGTETLGERCHLDSRVGHPRQMACPTGCCWPQG